MVDFNSEGAFSSNKGHILELIILGRRDELINTFQLWSESKLGRNAKEESLKIKLRSVLLSLFLELDRPLFRMFKRSDNGKKGLSTYADLKLSLLSDVDIVDADLVSCFFLINTALDDLNMIKIDNKKSYDSTNVEAENAEKGL